MTVRRRLGCLASLTAVALALTACTDGDDDETSFGDELASYSHVAEQRVTLEDGTELAVGSRDESEFTAQWREPGGSGWSDAEPVVEDADLDADEVTLTGAGDTAVAGLAWYAEDDDERESHARRDAVACQAFSCDLLEDVDGTPMLDAEGGYAAVEVAGDEDDDDVHDRFAVWEAGSAGWDQVELDGLPGASEQFVVPAVVLLGDGSFATVRGRTSGADCSFELWLSEPRGTTLTAVASTDPRPDPTCNPEWVQTDGTTVGYYDRSIDEDVVFTPTGSEWSDDLPDSGPLEIDDQEGRTGIGMRLTELEDGSSVAVGSPDLVRIVAQHRPAGTSEWTRPVTIARSTADRPCRAARSSTMFEHTDVMYVVSCWPRGSAWGDEYDDAPPPATGFALASADGRDWTAEPLDRPAYEPESQVSDRLLLARGGERSVFWRPGASAFEEVTLPLDDPTVDALTVTGDSVVRVTGNPDPSRPCRPTWSVAPLTATAWQDGGEILPIEPFAQGPHECYGVAIDQEEIGRGYEPGRELRVAGVIEAINGSVDGTLLRTAAGWRFRRG